MSEDMKSCLFVGAMIIIVILLLGRCSSQSEKQSVERNSRCYEQTQDKACWGIVVKP